MIAIGGPPHTAERRTGTGDGETGTTAMMTTGAGVAVAATEETETDGAGTGTGIEDEGSTAGAEAGAVGEFETVTGARCMYGCLVGCFTVMWWLCTRIAMEY